MTQIQWGIIMIINLTNEKQQLVLQDKDVTLTIQTTISPLPKQATYLFVQSDGTAVISTKPLKIKAERIVAIQVANQPVTEVMAELQNTQNSQFSHWWQLLALLGIKSAAVKAPKKGKATHRFNQQLATMPFYVDYNGSQAIVYWQKRNQLVIKAGAQLASKVPLNKNGEVGFSARFAQQLREEHKNDFSDFITTKDVSLKSVNEVGLFLYFGGTNSWQVLHNDQGKTLDELTIMSAQ